MQHIISSASTCLGCKKPKCEKGCPIGTPIMTMIKMFLEGKIKEAGEMVYQNNPLSIICSLVCPHEKHCEGHCILNKKHSPVNVGGIENYISSYYLDHKEFLAPKSNGKYIAVIGSGPAGIALALLMAVKGYQVTIYEEKEHIGGVLRYGIPDFRLDKRILDKIEQNLLKLGVCIRKNILIGKNIDLCDMFRDGFDAIFISTGVWRPKKIGLKGESLGNVHYAIDYLKSPKAYNLGKKVVVIGAGNVAMDVARTAIRNGADEVSIMYRKGEEDMSAQKLEIEYAKIDGVKFDLFKSPTEFTRQGLKYKKTNSDDENEYFKEAHSILVAISQTARDHIVKNHKDLGLNEMGFLSASENGVTKMDGVFASGDVVTGPRTVVEAVAFSKRVMDAIEEYLKNKEIAKKAC
ncbi:MAG: dihydropyrimidine dehydrogenase [Proteobacteria bacterium]|nr:MAG: dihydropyrimidine dehydrogenase [Pseudomonadota bacterium]